MKQKKYKCNPFLSSLNTRNVFHNFKTTKDFQREFYERTASDERNQTTYAQMVIQEGFAKDKGRQLKARLCLHAHRQLYQLGSVFPVSTTVGVTTTLSPGPAVRSRKGNSHFSGRSKRNKQGVKVPTEVSVVWAVLGSLQEIIWQTEPVSILIPPLMFSTISLLSVQQVTHGITFLGPMGNEGK